MEQNGKREIPAMSKMTRRCSMSGLYENSSSKILLIGADNGHPDHSAPSALGLTDDPLADRLG
ncbi:MAG: hypothetical protein AAB519_02695 [Patescibacteria group bacterium]